MRWIIVVSNRPLKNNTCNLVWVNFFERGNTGGSICFKKIMWGIGGIHECCALNFYRVFILILGHQLFLSGNFPYITSVLRMSCAIGTGIHVSFVGYIGTKICWKQWLLTCPPLYSNNESCRKRFLWYLDLKYVLKSLLNALNFHDFEELHITSWLWVLKW